MIESSCLCGRVRWQIEGPLQMMTHCHCGRCRKAHGAAFGTYAGGPESEFRLSGSEHVAVWRPPSAALDRSFCSHCGSVVPGAASDGVVFIPAGNVDGDIGAQPLAHIFVGSKAPWADITDSLPQFAAYPPGVDSPVLPDLDLAEAAGGGLGGSCLCGAVAFVVEGKPLRAVNCHCGRCRKARSAPYASNLVTPIDAVRFTRGKESLVTYKVPEAKHFAQVFCRICGSPQPRHDESRNICIVPMGALDNDPGIRPQYHIFVGSKAAWDTITDDLPQHEEYAS